MININPKPNQGHGWVDRNMKHLALNTVYGQKKFSRVALKPQKLVVAPPSDIYD